MKTTKTKFPYHPMRLRLKTPYKTKLLWVCYDGDDKLEVYRDKEEQNWVATIDINTERVEYYWSKYSVKPKTSSYTMIIPEIHKTYTNIKVVPVSW